MSNVLQVSQQVGVQVVRANKTQVEPPAPQSVESALQFEINVLGTNESLLQKEEAKCSSQS